MNLQQIHINDPNVYPADVTFTYLRLLCICNRCGIFLSTSLSHALPTSPKTPVNDVDYHILLLRRHLVVAWQAQPSSENIGSNVFESA